MAPKPRIAQIDRAMGRFMAAPPQQRLRLERMAQQYPHPLVG
jgi:hypothetical protein